MERLDVTTFSTVSLPCFSPCRACENCADPLLFHCSPLSGMLVLSSWSWKSVTMSWTSTASWTMQCMRITARKLAPKCFLDAASTLRTLPSLATLSQPSRWMSSTWLPSEWVYCTCCCLGQLKSLHALSSKQVLIIATYKKQHLSSILSTSADWREVCRVQQARRLFQPENRHWPDNLPASGPQGTYFCHCRAQSPRHFISNALWSPGLTFSHVYSVQPIVKVRTTMVHLDANYRPTRLPEYLTAAMKRLLNNEVDFSEQN